MFGKFAPRVSIYPKLSLSLRKSENMIPFLLMLTISFLRVNAGPYAEIPPSYLASSIHSLLLSTLLQPSAVLLAVWYIVRLPAYFGAAPLSAEFPKERTFRAALLADSDTGFERDSSEASPAFRLVVLGCMLANKWLDDHTFSNKTWYVKCSSLY
jgi:hypothetical protein